MTSFSSLFERLWRLCLLCLLLHLNEASAGLDNETSPTSQFRSRPDLHPPIVDLEILEPDLVSPGYIFVAPYRNLDPGPYIYDNYGNLVWSGAGHSGPKTAHTPRVCQYKGSDHLCYFTGEQHQGFARGHGVIMDNHYRTVTTVEAVGAGASSDMHEFKMTPYSNGTSALLTVYQPRQYDLSTNPRFNVNGGMGWIVEGVFQEIEIETGRLLFEWRSLDHVDPGNSITLPSTTDTSGDGLDELSPWDYFHLNSIDKNADGDYLISARHVSAIYKLSGEDGSIIWEMSDRNTATFELINFTFSYQHHARWVSENSTHTILSFYDNGSNSYTNSSEFSHGWIISIDHEVNTATMIKEWCAPEEEGGLLSGSQGNIQLLPNGGAHIGWGEHAFWSEHLEDGTCVQYAKLASRPSNVMIYRSNKYNWTGEPLSKPALWTFSKTGEDNMVFYVSWNGATEVYRWAFWAGNSSSGPFYQVATEQKTGFETVHRSDDFSPWAYAQALDVQGRVLAESVIARTFVPSTTIREFCTDDYCEPAVKVEEDRVPFDADVYLEDEYYSPLFGFNTSHYYHGDDTLKWTEQDIITPTTGQNRTPTINSIVTMTVTMVPEPEENTSQPSSYVGTSIIILIVGMVMGITSSFFLIFLYRAGAFRFLEPLVEKWLGYRSHDRYQQVWEKDMDDASSNADSSIPLYSRTYET